MTLEEFNLHIEENPALMLYLYGESCGVCSAIGPRVEKLVQERFPKLVLLRADARESRQLAGQLRMLNVPGILLMIDGKEYFRANGIISIGSLEARIERPYKMMFGEDHL